MLKPEGGGWCLRVNEWREWTLITLFLDQDSVCDSLKTKLNRIRDLVFGVFLFHIPIRHSVYVYI